MTETSDEHRERSKQLPGPQQLICHPDTSALGGPGPTSSWTQFAVPVEAPPLSEQGSAVTLVLAARTKSGLQSRRAYISLSAQLLILPPPLAPCVVGWPRASLLFCL